MPGRKPDATPSPAAERKRAYRAKKKGWIALKHIARTVSEVDTPTDAETVIRHGRDGKRLTWKVVNAALKSLSRAKTLRNIIRLTRQAARGGIALSSEVREDVRGGEREPVSQESIHVYVVREVDGNPALVYTWRHLNVDGFSNTGIVQGVL